MNLHFNYRVAKISRPFRQTRLSVMKHIFALARVDVRETDSHLKIRSLSAEFAENISATDCMRRSVPFRASPRADFYARSSACCYFPSSISIFPAKVRHNPLGSRMFCSPSSCFFPRKMCINSLLCFLKRICFHLRLSFLLIYR